MCPYPFTLMHTIRALAELKKKKKMNRRRKKRTVEHRDTLSTIGVWSLQNRN